MIAVANRADDGGNCGDGPKNGPNENWLPGMDSNHELDKILMSRNLLILQKSLKSSKASKAGPWYKKCTKIFCLVI
jgi:hypothetical protein